MKKASNLTGAVITLILSLTHPAKEYAQSPIVVDFDDLTGVNDSIRDQQPPVTFGIATFSGGGIVTNAAFVPSNQTPMYSTTRGDASCDPPSDGCYIQGCNTCASTVTVTFSQPVEYVTFDLYGIREPSGYRIWDDQGHEQEVSLPADGVATIELPYDRIRGINITYTTTAASGAWRILVDKVRFYRSALELDIPATGEVRVLTHRFVTADNGYPSLFQTADRSINISGTLLGAPQHVAGRTVYLRVTDPPDTAPYIPAAERHPNDNHEPLDAYPRLPAQVTTDAGGRFSAVLRTTDHDAGDNYRIEASTDPALGTNPSYECKDDCVRGGTITAWKRIYVELDRMFRAGAFIKDNVTPCHGSPCPATLLVNVDNAGPLAHAKKLRLMHAPRNDGQGVQEFYSEDVDVIKVDRKNNTVEVTMPTRAYFGPDFSAGTTDRVNFMADALGMVSGVDDTDLYRVNLANVSEMFNGAFVEYSWIDDDPAPYVPHLNIVHGDGIANPPEEALALSRKWFHRYGDDNVQHLLAAATLASSNGTIFLGLTTSKVNTNFAWLATESIADQSPRRAEWRFNGEVTVHELAHEWQVNPLASSGNSGHCGESRYDDAPSSARCTGATAILETVRGPVLSSLTGA